MNGLELSGYAGSVLVAVSLMMSNLKQLRWINLSGAGIFALYGFLIQAWPVAILNGWIALVDIYYLWILYRQQDQFDLLDTGKGVESDSIAWLFIHHYYNDIKRFFIHFSVNKLQDCHLLITFRNLKSCGLLAYRIDECAGVKKAWIEIDYVSPEVRDFKNSVLVFLTLRKRLLTQGVSLIETAGGHRLHEKYLLKIGFTKSKDPGIIRNE